MQYRYFILTSTYDTSSSFGIAATVNEDGQEVIVRSYADLCGTCEPVAALVELCNRLCLEPAQLPDVVEDFLADREWVLAQRK